MALANCTKRPALSNRGEPSSQWSGSTPPGKPEGLRLTAVTADAVAVESCRRTRSAPLLAFAPPGPLPKPKTMKELSGKSVTKPSGRPWPRANGAAEADAVADPGEMLLALGLIRLALLLVLTSVPLPLGPIIVPLPLLLVKVALLVAVVRIKLPPVLVSVPLSLPVRMPLPLVRTPVPLALERLPLPMAPLGDPTPFVGIEVAVSIEPP